MAFNLVAQFKAGSLILKTLLAEVGAFHALAADLGGTPRAGRRRSRVPPVPAGLRRRGRPLHDLRRLPRRRLDGRDAGRGHGGRRRHPPAPDPAPGGGPRAGHGPVGAHDPAPPRTGGAGAGVGGGRGGARAGRELGVARRRSRERPTLPHLPGRQPAGGGAPPAGRGGGADLGRPGPPGGRGPGHGVDPRVPAAASAADAGLRLRRRRGGHLRARPRPQPRRSRGLPAPEPGRLLLHHVGHRGHGGSRATTCASWPSATPAPCAGRSPR